MCLIIDICAVHLVVTGSPDFIPVWNWLNKGAGKMIIGGTTYSREFEKLKKYTKLIAELARKGKVVKVNKESVDKAEKEIKSIEPAADFDDPHIVALVEVSGCRIVCTIDARSDKYLKDGRFYKKSKKPSIYRNSSHAHLLCKENIASICKK